MDTLFLQILNISIMGSYFALAVMLFRRLFKKAPKWLSCTLWGLVGLRLINPFSFESFLSLIPSKETFPQKMLLSPAPEIQSGVEALNNAVNPVITETLSPQGGASVNPMQIFGSILCIIWLSGICVTMLYCAVTYIRLKRKVKESMNLKEKIFICDHIDTPFILGVIKPKIYLPSSLSEEDTDFVITHEKAHLRRHDHLWKPLGFLVLSLHWFNPLMWFCYKLFSTDIELACDEKVLNEMGSEKKKLYSTALINCSSPSKLIAPCPLAFGETGVKQRVKSILNYKKPAFWAVVTCLVISAVLAFCFITDPKDYKGAEISQGTFEISDNLYNFVAPNKNFSNTFCITDDFELLRSFDGGEWESYGQLNPSSITKDDILKNAQYSDEGWFKYYRIGEIKEAFVTVKDGEQSDSGKYIVLTEKGDLLYINATINENGIQPVIIDKLKKVNKNTGITVSHQASFELDYDGNPSVYIRIRVENDTSDKLYTTDIKAFGKEKNFTDDFTTPKEGIISPHSSATLYISNYVATDYNGDLSKIPVSISFITEDHEKLDLFWENGFEITEDVITKESSFNSEPFIYNEAEEEIYAYYETREFENTTLKDKFPEASKSELMQELSKGSYKLTPKEAEVIASSPQKYTVLSTYVTVVNNSGKSIFTSDIELNAMASSSLNDVNAEIKPKSEETVYASCIVKIKDFEAFTDYYEDKFYYTDEKGENKFSVPISYFSHKTVPDSRISVSYQLLKRSDGLLDFSNADKTEIKAALEKQGIEISEDDIETIIPGEYAVADIKITIENGTQYTIYPESMCLINTPTVYFDRQYLDSGIAPGEKKTLSQATLIEKSQLDSYSGNYNDEFIFKNEIGHFLNSYMNFNGVFDPPVAATTDESFTTTSVVDNAVTYTELTNKTFKATEEVYYNTVLSYWVPTEEMPFYEIDHGLRLWQEGENESEGYKSLGILAPASFVEIGSLINEAIKTETDAQELKGLTENNKYLLKITSEAAEDEYKNYCFAVQNDGSVYMITSTDNMLIGVWKIHMNYDDALTE